jgi:hypothetical protein
MYIRLPTPLDRHTIIMFLEITINILIELLNFQALEEHEKEKYLHKELWIREHFEVRFYDVLIVEYYVCSYRKKL